MCANKLRDVLSLIFACGLLAACGGGGLGLDTAGPAGVGGVEIRCSQHNDPRLDTMSDEGIQLTSALGLASGRYALPATSAPTQLVVFFHGNHNDSCSWRNHLRQAAARGAVAVAMDYTGQPREQQTEHQPEPVSRYGWFVRAGAADSIAAAKFFMTRYPSITQVFAFGVSMGGNASGIAVASADAVRSDGSPLFDYWLTIEGVNNLIEEYLIIRALAPGVAAAAIAQQEIEEENGGPIEEVPDRYEEITNILRVPDMTGLKGVVVVHGLDDGLVSTTESPEMAAALNLAGVPAHLYTVVLKDDGESGSTVTGNALGEDGSPFAGHGWEGSDTQLVITTGFEQLFALMDGGTVDPGETIVPGL